MNVYAHQYLRRIKIKKIITENVCPPISYRGNDWIAHYDGEEEEGHRGWGKTEQEAIDDLKEWGEE